MVRSRPVAVVRISTIMAVAAVAAVTKSRADFAYSNWTKPFNYFNIKSIVSSKGFRHDVSMGTDPAVEWECY
jgi:hypothetical protein